MSHSSEKVTDPICGMTVDPATAEYEGHTYYFCSQSCALSFKADPAKYAAGAGN